MLKCVSLLKEYLAALNIQNTIQESQDWLGYLVCVKIKKREPNIGILFGRGGKNIEYLKYVLRTLGYFEKVRVSFLIKLED
jgi:predicted RNA-binding protein YlqC (UPF0109 family)